MNKKLYIGNLSLEVTENDLNHNFGTVGTVLSAVIIKDKYSHMSKGFGFVEMETEEAARLAIEKFNGGELQGKKIMVSEAKEKKEGAGGGGFGNRDRSGSGYPRGGSGGGGGRRY